MMNKFVYYFFFLMATTAIVFLTSCEEDPEIPGGAITIGLSPSDDVKAAPGDTVEIDVTLTNVATGTEATVLSNPGGVFAGSDNTAASGESVSFVIPNDAEIGDIYTLTFSVTSGGAQESEQLDITVGYSTVAEVVMKHPDLSLLEAALVEAGMVSALQGDGPFTFFAPSNAAFQAMGIDSEADFPEAEELMQILNYHVLSGTFLSADFEDGSRGETLEGSDVRISTANGVMINEATVTVPDLVADNGVVHIIDEVLLPSNSVGTATAVLLGGQLNATLGSFYNVVDNEVYTSSQAQSNGSMVDLLYWYVDDQNPATQDSEAVIGSPDDEFADDAFINTDFSTMTNATRFKTLSITVEDFDGVVSQKDLEDAYSSDTEADQSRLTNLVEGQVFAFMLDEDRGGNMGLVKVVDISGAFGSERKIEIEVKHVK